MEVHLTVSGSLPGANACTTICENGSQSRSGFARFRTAGLPLGFLGSLATGITVYIKGRKWDTRESSIATDAIRSSPTPPILARLLPDHNAAITKRCPALSSLRDVNPNVKRRDTYGFAVLHPSNRPHMLLRRSLKHHAGGNGIVASRNERQQYGGGCMNRERVILATRPSCAEPSREDRRAGRPIPGM